MCQEGLGNDGADIAAQLPFDQAAAINHLPLIGLEAEGKRVPGHLDIFGNAGMDEAVGAADPKFAGPGSVAVRKGELQLAGGAGKLEVAGPVSVELSGRDAGMPYGRCKRIDLRAPDAPGAGG